jgi:hypothetical protein
MELSKAYAEFDEHLKEVQAREQHVADDMAWQGDLKATADVAKTASDSTDAARVMAEQLRRQLIVQKEAHKKELSQLKAERILMVEEHNSILAEAGFTINATSLAYSRTS